MIRTELPYNDLPLLPPARTKIETIAILKQVSKAAAAVGELKGLSGTLPNPSILLNATILREASASSEIENIITTQDRIYKALSVKSMQVDSATKEVLRYREALLKGYHIFLEKGFINTNGIIQIQQTIEENSAGIRRLPGTALKNIATGTIIYTPPDNYETIVALMNNYERYYNEEDDISPFIKMAIQHYQFESIHPFYDGNGRTGRILNVLYLIMNGCLDSPILYLSKYIIDNKSDYYRLLQEVRITGDWENWVLYMVKGVEVTAIDTIQKIYKINELFNRTIEKIKHEKPRIYNKELLELLFVQPYCRIESVMTHLSVTRPSASRYLNEIAKTGVLNKVQVWKDTLFINNELFNLLKE